MSKYEIGAKINARLADRYHPNIGGGLTVKQANLARVIIGKLRRSCEEGCCARGMFRGLTVNVSRGSITIGNNQPVPLLGDEATVGETVCAAVKRGVQFNGSESFNPQPNEAETAEAEAETAAEVEAETVTPITVPPIPEGETPDLEADPDPTPDPIPAMATASGMDKYRYLIRRWEAIREFLDADPQNKDIVSYRAFEMGKRMLGVGLPVEAALHAYALNWSDEARARCEIPTYDYREAGESIDGEIPVLPYILKLIEAKVPVMLIGPAGTGKTHVAQSVADHLNYEFGDIPMTEGASIAWLFGRQMPGNYVSTDMVERYVNGGVMLIDEMDAADPNMLLGMNKPIANAKFTNPITGEVLYKSETFTPIAAMNTFGTGATAEHAGRNRADGATIDRWRLGRVYVDYDRATQRRLGMPDGETF